ncbi:MAG: dockerin type I domain-containing protein [Pirellulales bacterium]
MQRFDGTTGAFIDDFTGENSVFAGTNLLFGPDNNLYVGSYATDQVLRFNGATGAMIDVFASDPALSGPSGMVFDANDDLLVVSLNTGAVLRFDGATGAADGNFITLNQFAFPSGAAYGPDGDYYVTTLAFNTVERFTPAGAPVATVASGNGLMLPANIEFIVDLTPGDANGDGKVDGVDYLVWAGHYGEDPAADPPGSPANGDFDGNGVVDGLDYLVWASNFGHGPNDTTSVPEPSALLLLCGGVALLFATRRPSRG